MTPYLTYQLNLRRAIWNQDARKSILNKALSSSADKLDSRLHENIDKSTPAGRFYSKKVITERRTAQNRDFRAARGRKTRVVVGRETYQASAQGQPPARRFSTLYRNLQVRRVVGKLAILARVRAPGVRYLDSPDYFDRPFFREIVLKFYREEFNEDVREAYLELLRAR